MISRTFNLQKKKKNFLSTITICKITENKGWTVDIFVQSCNINPSNFLFPMEQTINNEDL